MFKHARPLSQEYLDYITGPIWQRQRAEALREFGNVCPGCAATHGLQVHHLRYGNLYDITTEDLIPLCERCHMVVHNSDTLRFKLNDCKTVREKRQTLMLHLNKNPYSRKDCREVERYRAQIAAKGKGNEKSPTIKTTNKIASLERRIARLTRRGRNSSYLEKKKRQLAKLLANEPPPRPPPSLRESV